MFTNAKQKGISFWGLISIMIIAGLALLFTFKIGPLYMENMTVQSILDSVKDRFAVESENLSSSKVRDYIQKQLQINNINLVDEKGRSVVNATSEGGGINVMIEYEKRVPLIANLDIIAKFKNSKELPTR
ncbi:hypothetical protein TI03_01340 [Achromatium sp. WMS1]|nr:hypothetical protein TI03_01340 [Achromatium sp. WMS1]